MIEAIQAYLAQVQASGRQDTIVLALVLGAVGITMVLKGMRE